MKLPIPDELLSMLEDSIHTQKQILQELRLIHRKLDMDRRQGN